jgi:hypothetical protein
MNSETGTPSQAAASSPNLIYTISPAGVNDGTVNQVFNVTFANEGEAEVVVHQYIDSVIIGNFSALTSSSVSPVMPVSPWQISPGSSGLQFWTLHDVVIAAKSSVTFSFSLNLLPTPGKASLSVVESLGGDTIQAPPLIVTLRTALSISAFASPPSTGQQRAVMLTWNTVGGSYVTVKPGTDDHYSAGTSSIFVTPAQEQPKTVYTLTVYQLGEGSNDPESSSCEVTVTLCTPVVKSLTPSVSNNLQIGQAITLNWGTQYATQVTIAPALGQSPFVQPEGPQIFTPSATLPSNATSVDYTLIAYGYKGPVSRPVSLTFSPMRIRWFRYTAFPTLENPTPPISWNVFNQQAGTTVNGTSTPKLLTAVGPGGPASAELGGNGPEVQVMIADSATVGSGKPSKISYKVAHVIALKLNPGNIDLQWDQQGIGSTVVSPSVTTTYTLVATNGSATVSSELDITVSS